MVLYNQKLELKLKSYFLDTKNETMQSVYAEIKKIAKYDINVLILGESGTGKEVIAEYVHFLSPRKNSRLVKFNCSALPESLIESELFGYTQGAFSGAQKPHDGIFKYAHAGTLLLDEIGDLSPTAQAKILRAVDDGSFKKIGSNSEEHSDFRLLCATNKNLRESFREDLYYRIAEDVITIPPLRNRKEDLIDLSLFILKELSAINRVSGLSSGAREKMLTYNFPGNIRELKSMLKRAVFLTDNGHLIQEENIHLNLEPILSPIKFDGVLDLDAGEEKLVLSALENAKWKQSKAAKLLNISPRSLNYKIKKYHITHDSWKKNKKAPD